jgi:hypothetical protein
MPLKYFHIPAIRDQFKLMFIACLILIIYLPSLRSGFFIFDDFTVVEGVRLIDVKETWLHLGTAEDRYWRPVVLLSFMFDVHLLNANSSWMHLHNILLHITNTILIFFITRLFWREKGHKHEFPLLAAALFAIHPINTEAVSWIAGRCDLYASFFSLIGIYFFLLSIQSKKIFLTFMSALFFMLGCLSKESAFPLFPAAIVCLLFVNERQLVIKPATEMAWRFTSISTFLIGAISYLWLRSRAFTSIDQGIAKIVSKAPLTFSSLIDQTLTGITTLGFYIKKIFIPYPLNFAIDHVSHFYLWGGLLTIALVSFIIYQRNIESTLLIFMLFTISLAILSSILLFSWTPYAERYLYLPTAFICIYLCTPNKLTKVFNGWKKLLISVFFLFALTLTVNRNLQWSNSSRILTDAIRQNPDNIALRINYAAILENSAGPMAAREELHIALNRDPENQFVRRNLALISLKSLKDPFMARNDLNVFFNGELNPDELTLSLMIDINKECLKHEEASEDYYK